MPYGLTTVEQGATLKQYSSKKSDAVVVDLAEKKFILFDAKIEIPENLLNEDPRKNEDFQDWILDALRHNVLFGVFLATEWTSDFKYQIA